MLNRARDGRHVRDVVCVETNKPQHLDPRKIVNSLRRRSSVDNNYVNNRHAELLRWRFHHFPVRPDILFVHRYVRKFWARRYTRLRITLEVIDLRVWEVRAKWRSCLGWGKNHRYVGADGVLLPRHVLWCVYGIRWRRWGEQSPRDTLHQGHSEVRIR